MQAAKNFIIWVLVALGVVLVGGLVLASIFGVLLEFLYIVIIILALLMVASTLFTIYSVISLIRTLRTVQNEMKPLLASVQETVGIVKDTAQSAGHTVSTIGETAKLTSEWALAPAIGTVASVVAAGGMARSFFGKGHVRNRAERRREEQAAAVRAAKEASARGER